jgi:NAD(P)-dependent dehydrogenase (short-subunit alcohol dehydrogenase family)
MTLLAGKTALVTGASRGIGARLHDIAGAIAFLAPPEARWMTGALINREFSALAAEWAILSYRDRRPI